MINKVNWIMTLWDEYKKVLSASLFSSTYNHFPFNPSLYIV